MKSSKVVAVVFAVSLVSTAAARAAHVDMNDPRRAVGREDDIRIDAELSQDTVASGAPVAVTFQIENLSKDPVAIAAKACDVSYDADSASVVVSIGTEVPADGAMPKLVTLAPGETKTFNAGGIVHVAAPANGNPFVAVPRYVQIKVNVLRGLKAFAALIEQQTRSAAPVVLSDAQFEQWLENNDTIMLNEIPVRFSANPRNAIDASQRGYAGASAGSY